MVDLYLHPSQDFLDDEISACSHRSRSDVSSSGHGRHRDAMSSQSGKRKEGSEGSPDREAKKARPSRNHSERLLKTGRDGSRGAACRHISDPGRRDHSQGGGHGKRTTPTNVRYANEAPASRRHGNPHGARPWDRRQRRYPFDDTRYHRR